MGSFYVAQANLKFLGSSDPLALVSRVSGITGVQQSFRIYSFSYSNVFHLNVFSTIGQLLLPVFL